jgi:hypothetical protein
MYGNNRRAIYPGNTAQHSQQKGCMGTECTTLQNFPPLAFITWQPLAFSTWQPLAFIAWQPLAFIAWQPLSYIVWQPLAFIAWQPLAFSTWQTWPSLRGTPWPSLRGSPWPSLRGSPWPPLHCSPWPALRGSPGRRLTFINSATGFFSAKCVEKPAAASCSSIRLLTAPPAIAAQGDRISTLAVLQCRTSSAATQLSWLPVSCCCWPTGHGNLFQANSSSSKSAEPPAAKAAHLTAYYAAPPTDTGTVMAATPQQLQAYSSVWPSAAFLLSKCLWSGATGQCGLAANLLPWDSLLSKVPHLQQQFLLFTCLLVCQLLLLRIQSLGRVV